MKPHSEYKRNTTPPTEQTGMVIPRCDRKPDCTPYTTVTVGPRNVNISAKGPRCDITRIRSG